MKKYRIRKNSPADVLKNIIVVSVAIAFVSIPSTIEYWGVL